jgi:hypothetical protein
LAKRSCEASSLTQIEARDARFSPKPSKRRSLNYSSQECAVPLASRQREQWQFRNTASGPSTSAVGRALLLVNPSHHLAMAGEQLLDVKIGKFSTADDFAAVDERIVDLERAAHDEGGQRIAFRA